MTEPRPEPADAQARTDEERELVGVDALFQLLRLLLGELPRVDRVVDAILERLLERVRELLRLHPELRCCVVDDCLAAVAGRQHPRGGHGSRSPEGHEEHDGGGTATNECEPSAPRHEAHLSSRP